MEAKESHFYCREDIFCFQSRALPIHHDIIIDNSKIVLMYTLFIMGHVMWSVVNSKAVQFLQFYWVNLCNTENCPLYHNNAICVCNDVMVDI